ncbi:transposable element Tcb2 transposase [Trichonephila clavipes]|uniref:Transposable element Tcb2 transposase n=1 Tax=Trichonephila clavipes TaxID=2585209 RepID=A0A8X6SX94_TRICX|nr:transposable element Tcb2 transposase [Trichonephila clavipes]
METGGQFRYLDSYGRNSDADCAAVGAGYGMEVSVVILHFFGMCVLLEIVGSRGHEKVLTCGKPGLERPGRPRRERIEGSCGKHLWTPTVTRSTIRAVVGVAIVLKTISRHLAEANLKSKRPFRALPLTPEHRQLRLQWCQARSMWNVTDWQKVVFSDESRFVLGTDDNRVRVWRCPGERYNSPHTVLRHTARTAGVMV